MKSLYLFLIISLLTISAEAQENDKAYNNDNFQIESVTVKHWPEITATVWDITVQGEAGKTTPVPAGQLNGAPVLGYVFPTTLNPTDVGFGNVEGIVALALTSHPDFDDTPLWDESGDGNYNNNGIVWHPHWVVLAKDKRVAGGLSVIQFNPEDDTVVLPPTNPGMPMYMDSPGFQVITTGNRIRVVVPDFRIRNNLDFSYDGVTVYMQVYTGDDGNHSKRDLPMLGVYNVYSVASGNLSLPYTVK
ncbi:MAG: hypothetical protein WD607_06835 [Candidatus Paceibacterota bacterium]